jgi:hypothetical protein
MVKLFGCRTRSILWTDTQFCNPPQKKGSLIHGTADISFLTSAYSPPAKSACFYNQRVGTLKRSKASIIPREDWEGL